MTIIINALGNNGILSDTVDSVTVDSVTVDSVMRMCRRFAYEHYAMPEEIIIINNAKVIKIDLESALQSVVQSELEKQLQG